MKHESSKVALFKDDEFYSKADARKRLGMSDRAWDSWAVRAKLARYATSKRFLRWLGRDLNEALARAREVPA